MKNQMVSLNTQSFLTKQKLKILVAIFCLLLVAGCISPQNNPPTNNGSFANIVTNTLPAEMNEKLLFSHYNFDLQQNEIYSVSQTEKKLLLTKKNPTNFTQSLAIYSSPSNDQFIYQYRTKYYPAEYSGTNGPFPFPTNNLFLYNLTSGQDEVLLEVDQNKQIPTIIWSDDGKSIFYTLADLSTVRNETEPTAQGYTVATSMQVFDYSIWKMTVANKQKTLLLKSKAYAQGGPLKYPIDFSLIGFMPENKKLLISQFSYSSQPYEVLPQWQIFQIGTDSETRMSDLDVANPDSMVWFEDMVDLKDVYFNQGKLLYYFEKDFNAEIGIIDLQSAIADFQDMKKGIYTHPSVEISPGIFQAPSPDELYKKKLVPPTKYGTMSFQVLNNDLFKLTFYSGENKQVKIMDYSGKEVNTQVGNEVISISPKTNFKLYTFVGKKDSRGLNEWGLGVYYPNSNEKLVITNDNAEFPQWIN